MDVFVTVGVFVDVSVGGSGVIVAVMVEVGVSVGKGFVWMPLIGSCFPIRYAGTRIRVATIMAAITSQFINL